MNHQNQYIKDSGSVETGDSAHIQEDLNKALILDAFDLLGIQNRPWLRPVAGPMLRPVVRRIARAIANFEIETATLGFRQACSNRLSQFVYPAKLLGEKAIPLNGPLILASNHPAAYDAFILAASLPRDDVKILATNIKIVDYLPAVAEHFIFIGQAGQPDSYQRMAAVRDAIRHLTDGGTLLIFPSGLVDPDPAFGSGAIEALDLWHSSLALFLRRIPGVSVTITIVSGVLSKRWLNSPVTRLRKETHNRQKVAEVFQVIEQFLFPGRLMLEPRVSFSHPYKLADLRKSDSSDLTQSLISEAQILMQEHQRVFYGPPSP